ILIGLGNVPMPRPLTHDLFGNVLRDLSATLMRVEIVDLNEGTFYSNLVIQYDKHSLTIDARPSDAVALAVRAGCPVFIDEQIVLEAGVSTALIVEENPHMQEVVESVDTMEDIESPHEEDTTVHEPTELELLQSRLDKAVAQENYEEAARLRDRINSL
ncbi:MAG: bifunctional nuclease domain-containing protein, partial [Spirochaeta sp.]